jgi:hypothetical protein
MARTGRPESVEDGRMSATDMLTGTALPTHLLFSNSLHRPKKSIT